MLSSTQQCSIYCELSTHYTDNVIILVCTYDMLYIVSAAYIIDLIKVIVFHSFVCTKCLNYIKHCVFSQSYIHRQYSLHHTVQHVQSIHAAVYTPCLLVHLFKTLDLHYTYIVQWRSQKSALGAWMGSSPPLPFPPPALDAPLLGRGLPWSGGPGVSPPVIFSTLLCCRWVLTHFWRFCI